MIEFFRITETQKLDALANLSANYKDLHFSFSKTYIKSLKQSLMHHNAYQLFARDSKTDKIIGYIAGAENLHPQYFTIIELFVSPDVQRQGVGSKLIQETISFAEKQKLKGVIVQTEFKNIPAQKLYEVMKFQKIKNPEWKEGLTYQYTFKS